jgi:ABC-2 type transport system permease protein
MNGSSLVRNSTSVAFKELKQLRRDPVALALTFLFPILLISIVVVVTEAFTAPSYDIPIVIADLDSSAMSKSLVDKIRSYREVHVIAFVPTENTALDLVQRGGATAAVVIPPGFGQVLEAGGLAHIVLAADTSKLTSQQLVQFAVNRGIREILLDLGRNLAGGKTPPSTFVINRPLSGRPPSGDPILPGMLGMIIILGSFDDMVNAITKERERGTFTRLILTPINVLSIFSGKMLSAVTLTAARTTLVLVIFYVLGFQPRGSLALLYLTTALIGMFTVSVGLVLSTRIKSAATLTVLEIALTFPLFQLSGATQSPQLLASGGQQISLMLPWTYGNDALRRVLYLGLGLDAIFVDLTILFVSSLLMLPLATVLFRRVI